MRSGVWVMIIAALLPAPFRLSLPIRVRRTDVAEVTVDDDRVRPPDEARQQVVTDVDVAALRRLRRGRSG